jgi:hypothetical protein
MAVGAKFSRKAACRIECAPASSTKTSSALICMAVLIQDKAARKMFFFEKKNQKTFTTWAWAWGEGRYRVSRVLGSGRYGKCPVASAAAGANRQNH